MIVTVTLNPALHVGYETEQVRLGGANLVRRVSYRTGGRGLAVARVLHTFGHDVVAAGLAGGASGETIRAELAQAGVATQFTWISGESRRVIEVAGPAGDVTTFYEPAPYITTEELGRLAADYRSLMADATAAVLSGSLPAGLPAETYGSLATYAAEAGVPVVLDAGGSALWHGVSRRPALVIPEPEDKDPEALIANGARAVAVLSGGRVSAITAEGRWSAELAGRRAASPRITPERSAVAADASRDALTAGFVPGIALGWSWPETLAHAVALAASSGPAGQVDLDAYERLLPEVRVNAQAMGGADPADPILLRHYDHSGYNVRLGAVAQTGGELERRPQRLPERLPEDPRVPYRGDETANVIGWADVAGWIRDHGVMLSGLVLIVAQLIWKSVFLNHYYLYQDDIHFSELALRHSFTWSYLTLNGAGHLLPGVYAIAWVMARTALYNWAFAAAISAILLAAADIAALRLLRTLFGYRPAILMPLVIYLLCPLTTIDLRWWSAAMESLPLQVAIFMALNAQVYYVRTGRFRHAIAAAAWVAFGLLFFEKALILPVLLLAVTSGFLVEGPWLRSIGRSLLKYKASWLLQAALLAVYAVVLATSQATSTVQPKVPSQVGAVFTFFSDLLKDNFVPGALGGPWRWLPISDAQYADASPPGLLTWLSVIVAVLVILASIASRRYAWRSWAILALWLVAADAVPVLLGRIIYLSPAVLALDTHYVSDAVAVLAICLGLAFLPLAGTPEASRRRLVVPAWRQTGRTVFVGLVAAFVIGSIWSVQDLENTTSGQATKLYLTNAAAAVAEAPAGTMVFDSPVPAQVMIGAFGSDALSAKVIGPMESSRSAANIRFVARPDGTIDHLMVFADDGRLHQVAVFGQDSFPIPAGRNCQPVRREVMVVRFPVPTSSSTEVLHIPYVTTANVGGDYAIVSFGSDSHVLTVLLGLHDAYFTVRGRADTVTVSGPAVRGLCVNNLQVGFVVPSASGPVIPAQ